MSQQTIVAVQDNANIARALGAAAKAAVEVGKTIIKIIKDIKPVAAPPQRHNIAQTYASIAARGGLATSIHNPASHRAAPVQAQREIIINIRDPTTIAIIRAISPRYLKAHVDRAVG